MTGCAKVSSGCKHCYAERGWARLAANPKTRYFGRAFTDVRCHLDALALPLRWRRPRRIFVNSMSDLFHEAVPTLFIADVFAVMAAAPRHTFQILTKRPARCREILGADQILNFEALVAECLALYTDEPLVWPLPNVWLGVSVEDQQTADERIVALLNTPAAVRWVSAEPLLSPVSLGLFLSRTNMPGFRDLLRGLDWVVVGGESGPRARPMHPAWAQALRDQCAVAGVPFLFKQWGEWEISSIENGHADPDMARNNAYWVHRDGELTKPSWRRAGRPDELNSQAVGMVKVGRKNTGRVLDGALHDGYPPGWTAPE